MFAPVFVVVLFSFNNPTSRFNYTWNEFSLNAGIGHTDFSDDNGSYTDWNLGISRQFGPVNAAINYYDTDLDFEDGDDHNHASDQWVFTLSFGG